MFQFVTLGFRFQIYSMLFVGVLLSAGCSTLSSGVKALGEKGPVELKLQGKDGRVEQTSHYSHSRIYDFEKSQIVKEKDEIVEFKTLSRYTEIPKKGVRLIVETTHKDGMVDLRDLAYPERGESIEYLLTHSAEVLKAGKYPKDSVFFLPPVPLPDRKVSVGETWQYRKSWVTLRSQIPLSLDLVVIFKGLYQCGGAKCADLEISGNVSIDGLDTSKVRLQSRLSGQMVVVLSTGSLIYAKLENHEKIWTPERETLSIACMLSQLETEGTKLKWKSSGDKCTPKKREELSST